MCCSASSGASSRCRPSALDGWRLNSTQWLWLRLSGGRKPQREVDQFLFTPVNDPKVNSRSHFADFVADPFGHERSLRVIENDALLLVEPALVVVDLCHNRLVPKRQNLVPELAFDGI